MVFFLFSRDFPCKQCPQSFPSKAYLNLHMFRVHPNKKQRKVKNKKVYEQWKKRQEANKAEAAAKEKEGGAGEGS